MDGELEKKIIADIGSVDKMKEDFIQAGVGQFGSGWAWLEVKNGGFAAYRRERPIGRAAYLTDAKDQPARTTAPRTPGTC